MHAVRQRKRRWFEPRIIWLVFAGIFTCLAGFHFHQATQAIPSFSTPQRLETPPGGSFLLNGSDVDQPIKDFVSSFNAYLRRQNASSHVSNLTSAWGYLLAVLTSIFSFFREGPPPPQSNPAIGNDKNGGDAGAPLRATAEHAHGESNDPPSGPCQERDSLGSKIMKSHPTQTRAGRPNS